MTIGEHETQEGLPDRTILGRAVGEALLLFEKRAERGKFHGKPLVTPDSVDCTATCRGSEPRGGVHRHAVQRPVLDRRRERFL